MMIDIFMGVLLAVMAVLMGCFLLAVGMMAILEILYFIMLIVAYVIGGLASFFEYMENRRKRK